MEPNCPLLRAGEVAALRLEAQQENSHWKKEALPRQVRQAINSVPEPGIVRRAKREMEEAKSREALKPLVQVREIIEPGKMGRAVRQAEKMVGVTILQREPRAAAKTQAAEARGTAAELRPAM